MDVGTCLKLDSPDFQTFEDSKNNLVIFSEFLTNPQAVCKRKWETKSIDHLPAIQWGKYCEPFVIKDFERDHPGKVTMTGLHISKEHPNIGNDHSKEFICPKLLLMTKFGNV